MTELTRQEIESITSKAAEKAVNDVLEKLGMDTSNFRESQADAAFLRKQRLASEQIGKLTARAIIGLFVTGIFSVLLLGIKEFLNK